jgi:hypothetical protein
MWCVLIFGLFFIIFGLYMIIAKKGSRVFSKAHEDVTGGKAVAQGVIALLVGLAVLLFWYLGTYT